MTIPSDPDDRRNRLAKQRHEYGENISVSVPDEQPFSLYGTLNCRVPTTKVV